MLKLKRQTLVTVYILKYVLAWQRRGQFDEWQASLGLIYHECGLYLFKCNNNHYKYDNTMRY